VSLYYPSRPVPSPSPSPLGIAGTTMNSHSTASTSISDKGDVTPPLTQSPCEAHTASASLFAASDERTKKMNKNPSSPHSRQQTQKCTDGRTQSLLLERPFIASLFLSDSSARPWRFHYFHKSGAVKDKYVCYLYFTADGYVRGRGEDSIGVFFLFGQAEADITGWTWVRLKAATSRT
jgi:hypothetical protein